MKEGVDFVIDDFTQKGPENLLDDDITGFTEVTMELKMRKSPAKQRKLQPVPLQPKVPPKVPLASRAMVMFTATTTPKKPTMMARNMRPVKAGLLCAVPFMSLIPIAG